jgi:hypothetical protein
MHGDGFGGGLLKCLVGEEPARRIGEFRRGLAAQQRRFHERGGTITERRSHRSDVGDQRGVGQPIACNFAQRALTRFAAQIGDVVQTERYDGLTPVIITL